MSDLGSFGAWLRERLVREDADATPVAECPDPARIWDAVQGGATGKEIDDLLEHSLACPACATAWRLAAELSAQAAHSELAPLPRARTLGFPAGRVRPAWRWVAALAASALVLVGGSVVWRTLGPGAHQVEQVQPAVGWADLEVPVLEVQRPAVAGGMVFRDDAAGAERDAAIEAYRNGDFATAAERLSRWADTHPEDAQARLLHGVALLSAGHPESAVIPLEEAVSVGAADIAEDARFYLTLAYLKVGEEGKARAQLLVIEAGGGRWQPEAGRLLPKLAGGGGGDR